VTVERHESEAEQIMVTVPIPREALTVIVPPPVLLSQRNVEQVTGIPVDNYLRMLRSPDFDVAIMSDGKLRLVDRVAFVTWLAEHRRSPARGGAEAHAKTRPGDDADALLRSCGAKQKAKRRP
jgi:hypothetical protein